MLFISVTLAQYLSDHRHWLTSSSPALIQRHGSQALQQCLHKLTHVDCASKAKAPSTTTVVIWMDNAAEIIWSCRAHSRLLFDSKPPSSCWAKSLRNRISSIDYGIFQAGKKGIAALTHSLNGGRVEPEIEIPFVFLGYATNDEYLVLRGTRK